MTTSPWPSPFHFPLPCPPSWLLCLVNATRAIVLAFGTSFFCRARFTSFHPHASFLTSFFYFFVLFHSSCSHAQVFGKIPVHEFQISYSLTEWYLLLSNSPTICSPTICSHVPCGLGGFRIQPTFALVRVVRGD